MSGWICPTCGESGLASDPLPICEKQDCPMPKQGPLIAPFLHAMPKVDACEHDFQGWREFPDGRGGETVCAKCGIGAMQHSMRYLP